MCDTLYAGASYAADASAWFAKNSDRHPEEPQALCIVPARPASGALRVGSRELPLKDAGHAFALSKPSWMAGGEIGLNAKGVAIGNEAVFSRWKARKSGVLGMDILRGALSTASSAREATDWIASFTTQYEQGGNGAYRGKLCYDNSYIIADGSEAYILETAGRKWARKRIDACATISNAYGIHDDWEEVDAATSAVLSSSGTRGDWARHVEDRVFLPFTRGRARRTYTRIALESARGSLGLEAVLGALRSHGRQLPGRRGSMASPCMHEGGFPVDNATTASLAVRWPSGAAGSAILWFSGGSYPCISLFKPLLLIKGEFHPLWTDYDYGEDASASYDRWRRQLAWIRRTGAGRLSADHGFLERRDEAQRGLEALAREAVHALSDDRPDAGGIEAIRARVNELVAGWEAGLTGY